MTMASVSKCLLQITCGIGHRTGVTRITLQWFQNGRAQRSAIQMRSKQFVLPCRCNSLFPKRVGDSSQTRQILRGEQIVFETNKRRFLRPIGCLVGALLVSFGTYNYANIFPGTVDAFFGGGSLQNNFIADLVDKAGPAVVFVEVKGRHPTSGRRITLTNGSGFLVRKNGLVLTNAHVVENQSTVFVQLHDGSTHAGMVTAVDPVTDLATIKIDPGNKDLPVLPLGPSPSIRPGEFVVAMGSPLSLHRTTTVGIVSSPLRTSKELGLPMSSIEYIQTDAVIGLGNSGGPLVNMDGQAIGINTLKLTDGICFAIPTDYAKKLLDQADILFRKAELQKNPAYMPNGKESTRRRYVGITMLPVTPPILVELKEKNKDFPHIAQGVYVYKVVVSSPAYTGGIHAGDVITEINGEPMATSADIYGQVEKHDKLHMTVLRGKNEIRLTVVTEAF